MAKGYISNRQKNLKIGISSYTENQTVLEVIGNVGIGTTNPTAKLHVNGTVALGSSVYDTNGTFGTNGQVLSNVTGFGVSWTTVSGGGGGSVAGSDGQIQYNNNGSFGGAAQLYYDDVNNRVGIGTTTTRAKLSFPTTTSWGFTDGLISAGPTLGFYELAVVDSANQNYVRQYTAYNYSVSVGATHAFRVSNSEGTSTSLIAKGGMLDSQVAFVVNPDTSTELRYNYSKKLETTGYGVTVTGGLNVSGISTFQDKVGIGTTNPTQKLDVNGNVAIGGSIYDANGQPGTNGQVLSNVTGFGVSWINSSAGVVSITTSSTNSAFKVPFANTTASTTGNYGLLQDNTATFTYNPSTNTLVAGTFSGSGASLTNIPNGALDNSTVSYGGIQLSLGGSDATPAFDLSDATNYPFTSLTGITTNIVGDTTPQLGGDLDVNGNDITGTGNVNLTGVITATSFDGSLATTNLTGTITNAQLAGSIDNSKLSNSTVSYGGITLSLGGSDATPAFDLSDATNYPYSSLTGITTDIVGDTTPQLGGDLDLNGNDITGTGNINITGNLNVSGVSTFQGNVNLGDDDRLRLGDSQDLLIYHNGSNSFIQDVGTGILYLQSDGSGIDLQKVGGENLARFITDGAVELYYDNSKKFETTGIGISISNGGTDTATIAGPENIIIDPAAVGDNTGLVRIKGDLYVDGTTTQINSTTLELADFIVGIATTATSDLLSDGAGIQIGPNNTFLYEYNGGTNPSLKSSENLNVASGKHYQIGETEVLSATTLGSGVVNSSLTSVGTITTGTWDASTIAIARGGTNGSATPIAGAVPYGTGTAYAFSSAGTSSQILLSGGTGSPTWANQSTLSVGTATTATNVVGTANRVLYNSATNTTTTSGNLTFNGTNLGIGTDNPTQKLDVNGAARFRGAIYDNNNVVGTANSVLTSTGSGVVWAAPGGTQVSVGTEAPTSPSQGDLWYHTDIGRTFVYYQDGTSNQWVDSAPFNQNDEVVLTFTEKLDGATYYPIFTPGVGSTLPYITSTSNYFEFTPSTGTLDVNNLTAGNSIVVGSAVTITSGGITASGIITATTFVGNLTGTATNAQGLTGNPSISVTNINASGVTTSTTIEDSKGEVRKIPQSTNTTIVASDAGKFVSVATTVTINSSTAFSIGEAVTIFNNSASQIGINTDTVTMYQAGTANTGVRTLDQRGLATILCVGTDTYVISGAGLA